MFQLFESYINNQKNLLIKERFFYFTVIYLMQGIFRDDKKYLFASSK